MTAIYFHTIPAECWTVWLVSGGCSVCINKLQRRWQGRKTPTASLPLSFSGNKEMNLLKMKKKKPIQPLFVLQGALGGLLKMKHHDYTCTKEYSKQKCKRYGKTKRKARAKNSAKDIKGRRQLLLQGESVIIRKYRTNLKQT